LCSKDSVAITIPTSSSQFIYSLFDSVNFFTQTKISADYVGNGGVLVLKAPVQDKDSFYVKVQALNSLSLTQSPICFNTFTATTKINVNRFKQGPFLVQGTPYTGTYNAGTLANPDAAKVQDTLVYEFPAPSGLGNASYGTRWIVNNLSVKTAAGTNISNAPVLTPPSGTINAKYTIRPDFTDADSLFIITANVRLLPTGCDSTFVRYLRVSAPAVASYLNGSKDSICSGVPITFTSMSFPTASIVSYNWDFGDNTTASGAVTTKTFSTPGQYNVKLTVITVASLASSFQKTITILPKPAAKFTNGFACSLDSILFTNQSTGTSLTYNWNFAGEGTSTLTNPNFRFAQSGTFNKQVSLVAINNFGCTDTSRSSVQIFSKPIASFTVSNHCLGIKAPIINQSTLDTGTFGSAWYVGSQNVGLSNVPSLTIADSGTYQLKLVVTSNFGCRDSILKTVVVYDKARTKFAVTSASQCFNKNIVLLDSTRYSGGLANVNYAWDFGDNTSSLAKNPVKAFTAVGDYIIKLVTTETVNGCKDSFTKAVSIRDNPVALFTSTGNTCVGRAVNFTNLTIQVPSDTPTAYLWDFGSGSTSTAKNPSFTFATAGKRFITLTATTSSGCSSTRTDSLFLTPSPTVSFTKDTFPGAVWTLWFKASSNIFANYNWDFGNGRILNTTNDSVTNTYNIKGKYAVKLTVSDINGCTGTFTDTAQSFTSVGVSEASTHVSGLSVYPNPFSQTLNIDFQTNASGSVTVRLFDMLGRSMNESNKGTMLAGKHSVSLDAESMNLKSGIYTLQIQIGDRVITRQVSYQK
jgi:PKD repeat protein